MYKIEQTIEKLTTAIKRELRLKHDFDICELIKGLGGNIQYKSLPTGTFAIIESIYSNEEEFNFLIYISDTKNTTEDKIRYDAAKEIGHLILHLDFLDYEKWNTNIKNFKYLKEEYSRGNLNTESEIFAKHLLK